MPRDKKKTLFNKASKLWKEIAFARDGKECQVKKHFPNLRIMHTEILQVDHCISRNNKNLFFEPANSTVVCSACNMAKGFKNKSVDRAIDEIVINREGGLAFGMMVEVDQSGQPNHLWGKIDWLEQVIKNLEHKLIEVKNESAQR